MRNRYHKRVSTCCRQPHCLARRRLPRQGFTLLELLLVLSILVVIGGIVMVNLGGAGEDANNNATRVQIAEIKKSISYYKIRLNSLPDSLEELVDGPSDTAKKAKWTAPIMTTVPVDAWENEFVYSRNGNTYEIRSAGVDGQTNTDDDITDTGP